MSINLLEVHNNIVINTTVLVLIMSLGSIIPFFNVNAEEADDNSIEIIISSDEDNQDYQDNQDNQEEQEELYDLDNQDNTEELDEQETQEEQDNQDNTEELEEQDNLETQEDLDNLEKQDELSINTHVLYNGEVYDDYAVISIIDNNKIEITTIIPANYGADKLELNIPNGFILNDVESINEKFEYEIDIENENIFNFNIGVKLDNTQYLDLITTIEIVYLKEDSINQRTTIYLDTNDYNIDNTPIIPESDFEETPESTESQEENQEDTLETPENEEENQEENEEESLEDTTETPDKTLDKNLDKTPDEMPEGEENIGAISLLSIAFSDGDGTTSNPYQISTEAQLIAIENDLTAHYILTSNITLTADWTPIGSYSTQFTGSLDGVIYTISGLTINATSDNAGLFGYIGSSGSVKNLKLNSVNITSTNNKVGAIAGYNNGTIINSSISGSVYGYSDVGGIVGHNNGLINNCFNEGNITGTESVGGIAGGTNYNSVIQNCYNQGNVTATNKYAGGIVGYSTSCSVINCYNKGDVTATNGYVGFGSNVINNCYNYGSVSGTEYIGGICGYSWGNIANCYWLATDSIGAIGYGISAATDIYSCDANGNLSTSVIIDGVTYTSVIDALNAWIVYTSNNGYYYWSENTSPSFIIIDILETDFAFNDIIDTEYTGSAVKPSVTSDTLKENTDYTVAYTNNTNVGTAAVTITGIGNYTDEITITFNITPKDLTSSMFNAISSQEYTSDEITPTITSDTLTVDDYTVAYIDNIDVGTATITITGIGNYTDEITITFDITEKPLNSTMFNAIDNQEYTSDAIEPEVTSDTLTENTDFTVAYIDNTNIGTATIAITGIGNYTGTVELNFEIIETLLTISGKLMYDNGTLINGATIELQLIDGTVVDTTSTIAGIYTFDNVSAGNYIISVTYNSITITIDEFQVSNDNDNNVITVSDIKIEDNSNDDSSSNDDDSNSNEDDSSSNEDDSNSNDDDSSSNDDNSNTNNDDSNSNNDDSSSNEDDETDDEVSDDEVLDDEVLEEETEEELEEETEPTTDIVVVETDIDPQPEPDNTPDFVNENINENTNENDFNSEITPYSVNEFKLEIPQYSVNEFNPANEYLYEYVNTNTGTNTNEFNYENNEYEIEYIAQNSFEESIKIENILAVAVASTVAVVGAVPVGNIGLATVLGSGSTSTVGSTVGNLQDMIRRLAMNEEGSSSERVKFKRKKPFSEKLLLKNAKLIKYAVPQAYVNNFDTVKELLITANKSKSPAIISVNGLIDKVEQFNVLDGEDIELTNFEKVGKTIEQLNQIQKGNKIKFPLGYHISGATFDDVKQYTALGFSSIEFELPSLETKADLKELKKVCKVAKKNNILIEIKEVLADIDHIDIEKYKLLKKEGISTIGLELNDCSEESKEKLETIIKEIRKINKSMNISLNGNTNFSQEEYKHLIKLGITKIELAQDDISLTSSDKFTEKLVNCNANGKGTDLLKLINTGIRWIKNILVFI